MGLEGLEMVAVGERFRAARLDSPGVVSIQEYERQPLGPVTSWSPWTSAASAAQTCTGYATPEAQARMTYPMFLGHEWTGTVAELGERAPRADVTGQPLAVGDRVWVKRRSCGRCCTVLRHPEACIGRQPLTDADGRRRQVPGAGFAPWCTWRGTTTWK